MHRKSSTRRDTKPRLGGPADASANVVGGAGRWWRFDKYEIRRDLIAPARDAKLVTYEPWALYDSSLAKGREGPHRALLEFAEQVSQELAGSSPLRTKLSAFLESLLVLWCTRYGLLGILLHQATYVEFTPRWLEAEGDGDDRSWGHQPRYARSGGAWSDLTPFSFSSETSTRVDLGKEVERSRWEVDWNPPGVILHRTVDSPELIREPLGRTWAKFFPAVSPAQAETYDYPAPCSYRFWREYAEPVDSFVTAALALRAVADDLARWRPTKIPETLPSNALDSLLSTVNPVLRPGPNSQSLRWRSASLLGALSMMHAWDVAEKRAYRSCANCSEHFIPTKPSQLYCGPKCQNTAQKRRQRENARIKKTRSIQRRGARGE